MRAYPVRRYAARADLSEEVATLSPYALNHAIDDVKRELRRRLAAEGFDPVGPVRVTVVAHAVVCAVASEAALSEHDRQALYERGDAWVWAQGSDE